MVRIGATYTSESTIKLEDGNAKLNFGAMKDNYHAKLKDSTWRQECEGGIAITPAKGLTVAADVKWINWSAAIDQPVLKISNPDQPVPMTSRDISFDMAWEDQWVYAIGAEYVLNPMHTVRVGYNYGKSPVPDANLNPLFPAIVEQHVTLGYGLTFGQWAVNLAYEHAEGDHVLFLNPDLVFLPGCVTALYGFLTTHDDVGAVGPVGYWERGREVELPPNILPTLWDLYFCTLAHVFTTVNRRYREAPVMRSLASTGAVNGRSRL